MNAPPIPPRLRQRPVDHRGFIVPWFVWFDDDGKPDFRVIGHGKFGEACARNRCWLCGQPLGVFKTFVLGPLSVVQRLSGEPPSHHDCAMYAVRVCPFIANATMQRSPKALPDGTARTVAADIPGNPGVYCAVTVKKFEPFQSGRATPSGDGFLIRFGEPLAMEWYKQKRTATYAEVEDAFARSFPALKEIFSEHDLWLFQVRRRDILAAYPK